MIKPRLTDDAILTGADGFAPTPRNHVEAISPFFDDEDVNHELEAASKAHKKKSNSRQIAEDDDNRSNTSSESSDEEYLAARKRANQKESVPANRVRSTKTLQRLTEVDLHGADPAPSMVTPSGGMRVPISPFLDDNDMEQLQKEQARQQIATKPAKQDTTTSRASPSVRHPTNTPHLSGSATSSSATQRLSLGRTTAERLSIPKAAANSPSVQASPTVKRAWSSSLRADTRSVASSPGRVSVASTARGAKASPLKIDLTRPTGAVTTPNPPQYLSPSTRPVSSTSSIGRRPLSSARLSSVTEPPHQFELPSYISVATINDEWAVERRELQSRARKAEKQLAFMLILSATRRRRDKLLRYYFRRWRAVARPTMQIPDDDDAEALANELLSRLKSFRRET